jgi:hypothetical protein
LRIAETPASVITIGGAVAEAVGLERGGQRHGVAGAQLDELAVEDRGGDVALLDDISAVGLR